MITPVAKKRLLLQWYENNRRNWPTFSYGDKIKFYDSTRPSFDPVFYSSWLFKELFSKYWPVGKALKTKLWTLLNKKKPREYAVCEPPAGIEPATYWLQVSCSTSWAKEAFLFFLAYWLQVSFRQLADELRRHFLFFLAYWLRVSFRQQADELKRQFSWSMPFSSASDSNPYCQWNWMNLQSAKNEVQK